MRSNRSRWTASLPTSRGKLPPEVGEDPIARAFEQGPVPVLPVPPPTDDHLRLLGRLVGRPIDRREFEVWERVRAYFGYQGPALTPQLASELAVQAPPPEPTHRASSAGRSTGSPTPPKPVNPLDLGDD